MPPLSIDPPSSAPALYVPNPSLDPFYDYTDSPAVPSPTLGTRNPYLDSRLMRKNLLSVINPSIRQAAINSTLTKIYLIAQQEGKEAENAANNPSSASSSSRRSSTASSAQAGGGRGGEGDSPTRLMLVSLLLAFSPDFSFGLPLPRSPISHAIDLTQSLKDACRERITVDVVEVRYETASSDKPEQCQQQLVEILANKCRALHKRRPVAKEAEGVSAGGVVAGSEAKNPPSNSTTSTSSSNWKEPADLSQADVGRLVGRLLSAMCRTASGGDAYCAVNALLDIEGSLNRDVRGRGGFGSNNSAASGGVGGGGGNEGEGREKIAAGTVAEGEPFPFLVMPANVLGDVGEERQAAGNVVVDVPGPIRVSFVKGYEGKRGTREGDRAVIVTTSLMDIHLAASVMQPVNRGKSGNAMAKPLVRIKATVVEEVSMEIERKDRRRSLQIEVVGEI